MARKPTRKIAQKAARKTARKAKTPARFRATRPLTIDVHTHIPAPQAQAMLRELQHGPDSERQARYALATRRAEGVREPMAREEASDPILRLKKMDSAKIDVQLISVNTSPPFYALAPEEAQKISRIANETVAEFMTHAPDRFVGLGNVPLQSAEAAVAELEYAMGRLGLKGVDILTNVRGHDLGEEQFWPFWKRAEELGAVVFLHPLGFTQPDRLMKFRLANTVGQPLEEALAMLSLIHEGVMEKFPRLKIVMAHGGGYLPFYYGRSDSTFYRDPHLRGAITKPPSTYIKRFFLDTCVFDLPMIEFLSETAGIDRVVLGTDYPYRDWGAVDMILSSKRLGRDAKARILGGNAAKALGLAA